jgi:hypothetical protein
MRFIIQLWSDETRPPAPASVSALVRFNEHLAHAGVLLAAEGLVKSDAAVRITMTQSEHALSAGPFFDVPRLGSGFWIIRAKSKQEAVEWARRCPLAEGDQLEVRELYGLSDLALTESELAII